MVCWTPGLQMAAIDAQINLWGSTSPALMHHIAELHTQKSIVTFAVSMPGMLKDLCSAWGSQNLSNRPSQLNSFSGNSFMQLVLLSASWDADELLPYQHHTASLEGRGNFSTSSPRLRVYQDYLDTQDHLLNSYSFEDPKNCLDLVLREAEKRNC